MANPMMAKPIIKAILHLKWCEEPECKECIEGATHLGAVLSEVVEVAELVRRLGTASMNKNADAVATGHSKTIGPYS